jgi:hypothetical protein
VPRKTKCQCGSATPPPKAIDSAIGAVTSTWPNHRRLQPSPAGEALDRRRRGDHQGWSSGFPKASAATPMWSMQAPVPVCRRKSSDADLGHGRRRTGSRRSCRSPHRHGSTYPLESRNRPCLSHSKPATPSYARPWRRPGARIGSDVAAAGRAVPANPGPAVPLGTSGERTLVDPSLGNVLSLKLPWARWLGVDSHPVERMSSGKSAAPTSAK